MMSKLIDDAMQQLAVQRTKFNCIFCNAVRTEARSSPGRRKKRPFVATNGPSPGRKRPSWARQPWLTIAAVDTE